MDKNKDKHFQRVELIHNFGSLDYRYAFTAQDDMNNFYAIPMCAGNVLKYNIDSRKLSFLTPVSGVNFEYTGGAFDKKRNCIWGFPRNSNNLLKINVASEKVEEIPLNLKFEAQGIHGAHHYSGVLVDDCIFCPPRNISDGILKISLNNNFSCEIIPTDSLAGMNTHYSGSIAHPNGKIYFLPSGNNRVTVLDPLTNEIKFIGEKVNYMNFGGSIWKDGNIYCVCNTGVSKIDVTQNSVDIVYQFDYPVGFYGSAFHPNGKLYAYSANNDVVEYDPETNQIKVLAKFYDIENASSANTMGEVMSDGSIYLAPCQGRFFARLFFD